MAGCLLSSARTNNPEPRLTLDRTGLDAPQVLARDLKGFGPGAAAVIDASAFAFPITNLAELPAGDYCRAGFVRLQRRPAFAGRAGQPL